MTVKKITKIQVINPGSNPDVDTDFNTDVKDHVYNRVAEVYGKGNVCSIITMDSLAAKSAFKSMCTIYEIPFSQANKISGMIPNPIDGVPCTIKDIFNPASNRYSEGAEFRNATNGAEWAKIIAGASAIEGRYKSTGVHACGVLISDKPLYEIIPLSVRQTDGRVISQWTYPECESMGLIKFDFLGLDSVDLVQHTVEYIVKSGKPVPNMVDLIHGDMNDKKTYELFARGDVVGVFQFGSSLVQDFCKQMKPTEFGDLAATTALLRPGPMGMLSHVRYASRKNGGEEISPIHPEFAGSALDKILEDTYGLVVYQESILQLANQIAGMTLQEGDELRKAMGKKKIKVMLAMKPKFMEGGAANGFSKDALNVLWDTIETFAEYGFNKSHSVAYAMIAYQTAYLKTNYPVEFMAALISQNVGKKDEILTFLQEARKMGLKVGTVNINLSDVSVAPNFLKEGNDDIVYGISGVSSVSETMAKIIVKEREENGRYDSVQDLINRCSPLGVSNKRVYENLALAGAFDAFGITRQGVVNNLPAMIGDAKNSTAKGDSLFDMFGDDESFEEMDLSSEPEYGFVEKLQKEAGVIGLYLTAHPLMNVGKGLSQGRVTPIDKLLKSRSKIETIVVGSLTEIERKKMRKGGKSIRVVVDDGTGYIQAFIENSVVKGIDKKIAQDRIKKMYVSGETELPDEIVTIAANNKVEVSPDLESNNVYIMKVSYFPSYDDATPYRARVTAIRPLNLSQEGKLPIRIRVNPKTVGGKLSEMKPRIMGFAEAVSKKFPGNYPIHAAIFTNNDMNIPVEDGAYFRELAEEVKSFTGRSSTAADVEEVTNDLFGDQGSNAKKGKAKIIKNVREMSDFKCSTQKNQKISEVEMAEMVEYFDTGFTTAKTSKIEEIMSSKFGAERVDFGIFNQTMLED